MLVKLTSMIFGNRKQKKEINITINNNNIERVYVTKFLGGMIDNKLNWKEHINVICNKISRSMAVMYRASKLLTTKSMYTLYCTLILPYLNYCAENWGNTFEKNLSKIFLKQKRIIRMISKAHFREHTNPLFKKLKILKLNDLIKLRTAIVMYKANNNILPKNLQSLFIDNNTIHIYNLRKKHEYYTKYVRTRQKQMCLSIHGVKLWNSLSQEIKKSTYTHSFKIKYKLYLINNY